MRDSDEDQPGHDASYHLVSTAIPTYSVIVPTRFMPKYQYNRLSKPSYVMHPTLTLSTLDISEPYLPVDCVDCLEHLDFQILSTLKVEALTVEGRSLRTKLISY